jgi:hypothetical protein
LGIDRATQDKEVIPNRVTDARQNQKWGEALDLSPFLLSKVSSEFEAQANLNPSRTLNAVRGNQLGVDDAEGGWVGGVERWIQEINVIEKIEEVGREFEFHSLRNIGGFPEAHVEVPETETGERAVSTIVRVCG